VKLYEKYLTDGRNPAMRPQQKVRGKLKPRVSATLLKNSVRKAEENILSNLKTLTATVDILREHRMDPTKMTSRALNYFGDADFAMTRGANILRGVIKSIKE